MTNQVNNHSIIPSTDVIQPTLTLKMTTAQVVKTSVTVNSSPIKDYVHPDDHAQPISEMTPGFKPFTSFIYSEYANKEFLRCHYGDSNGNEKKAIGQD